VYAVLDFFEKLLHKNALRSGDTISVIGGGRQKKQQQRTLYAKQLPSSRSITSSGAAAAGTPTAPPLLPAKHSISSSLMGLGDKSSSCMPSSSSSA
jgi:hypothetical protein